MTLGSAIGCNSDGKKVAANNIQFDSVMVDKTYHMKDIETNPSCSLQIRFKFPSEFQNKEVLKAMQQQFASSCFGDSCAELSPQEAVNKYVEDYINNFKKEETSFEIDSEQHDSEPNESWYTNYEISKDSITYNHNDLLSYVVYKEYDTGGAHNTHSYTNRVLNVKTGQRIMESDIFIDEYQDDLAKIIVDAIALYNNVDKASDLENIGFFSVNEISPNNNFYVDDLGITYTFNEFDIAAYVVGATSIRLPYEKIRHLLRKDSPIAGIAF